MRFLLFAMFSALLLSGCAVEIEHGHFRHHRGWGHHHGHHRHYWNKAGEVYSESATIRSLVVLPAKMPNLISGERTTDEEAKLREQGPMHAAQIIAAQVTSRAEIRVTATVGDTKPSDGYYLEIEITQLDAGDRKAMAEKNNGVDGWSYLLANGKIYNAATGKVVVELTFEQSTGRYNEAPPFEALVAGIGIDLADWFKEKQAKPPTKS